MIKKVGGYRILILTLYSGLIFIGLFSVSMFINYIIDKFILGSYV